MLAPGDMLRKEQANEKWQVELAALAKRKSTFKAENDKLLLAPDHAV